MPGGMETPSVIQNAFDSVPWTLNPIGSPPNSVVVNGGSGTNNLFKGDTLKGRYIYF